MDSIVIAATLAPGGVVAWILVGLIAGATAGRVMSGRGYGCLADIVVGIAGAFVGGFIVSLFTTKTFGFIGSIVVAFIGASLLIGLLHAIRGLPPRL